MAFVTKFAQRPCHDFNFPIFPMAIKILMNEADRNSDRAASWKKNHCIHDNSILLFDDIMVFTVFKFYMKHLLQ